jgi:hypothetical protein
MRLAPCARSRTSRPDCKANLCLDDAFPQEGPQNSGRRFECRVWKPLTAPAGAALNADGQDPGMFGLDFRRFQGWLGKHSLDAENTITLAERLRHRLSRAAALRLRLRALRRLSPSCRP